VSEGMLQLHVLDLLSYACVDCVWQESSCEQSLPA